MGIKSMVLESDCLGLSHLLLWDSGYPKLLVYSTCLFFFLIITMCQVLFEVLDSPRIVKTKPSVCVELMTQFLDEPSKTHEDRFHFRSL